MRKIVIIIIWCIMLTSCSEKMESNSLKSNGEKRKITELDSSTNDSSTAKDDSASPDSSAVKECYTIEKLQVENYIDFNSVMKKINTEREAIINREPKDMSEYTPKKVVGVKDFTEEELQSFLTERFRNYQSISSKDAMNDVDVAFRLLKSSYGGYEYFGGDEVFNDAKERIEQEIIKKDNIPITTLRRLFFKNFEFLKDGHFLIQNTKVLKEKYFYYSYEDLDFLQDEEGYYTIMNNTKWYVKEFDKNKNVNDYMKLTINKNGVLVYNIGVLLKNIDSELSFKLNLVNDSDIKELEVRLLKSNAKSSKPSSGFTKKYVDDLPILTISSMFLNRTKGFLESAGEVKNEEVILLDLRGNSGGVCGLGYAWLKKYTDTDELTFPCFAGAKVSKLVLLHKKSVLEAYKKDNAEALEQYNETVNSLKNEDYNYWEVNTRKGVWQNNHKNTIFVLIDKKVASATENFIRALSEMNNVVFVGTNTSGCYAISNNIEVNLPKSKISIYFGAGLFLHGNFENLEGKGIEPDIWVNADDSLDRVLKLINIYKLNQKDK